MARSSTWFILLLGWVLAGIGLAAIVSIVLQ